MFRIRLTQPRLRIDGKESHKPHKTPYPFFVNPMPLAAKPSCHLRHSKKGRFGVLFINQAHQIFVIRVISFRSVVIGRPVQS
jgi:hypothetical protein